MIGKPKSAILMAYVYMASFGYLGILGRVPTCTKSAKRERYKSFIYGRVPISIYVNPWHCSSVFSLCQLGHLRAGWLALVYLA
jgi:hypothetical protein